MSSAVARPPMPQPLSARGVPGEAKKLVQAHGPHVPNYDIFGQQHYRLPVKDKGHVLSTEPFQQWTREPTHKTRSDLLTARRDAKHPDLSYDVDGDGAVGPTDYFLGKQFGREQDHRLNTAERAKLVRALEAGHLDKYSFGHEQVGAQRKYFVQQKRGKIVTVDNAHELGEIYPPHWNAHKEPRHRALTDLKLHRKAEMKNSAQALKEDFDAKNPAFVPEPPVVQEFSMAEPPITHISQRKEAMRQHARESAGLDAVNTTVNRHREDMTVGLGFREQPQFATRTDLQDARRAQRVEDLHTARVQAEQDYVPGNARHTWLDAEEYNFRRPQPDAMTVSKLRQQRRQEFIEHNMANFQHHVKEYNQYSKLSEPWHTLQEDYVHDPPRCLLKEMNNPPHRAEVIGKVTQQSSGVVGGKEPHAMMSGLGYAGYSASGDDQPFHVATAHTDVGAKVLSRWSTEFVPPSIESKAPRLFDGVKQAPTLSTDAAPLHTFSSFEPIRREAIRKDNERKQRTIAEDTERAHNWRSAAYGVAQAIGPRAPAISASVEGVAEAAPEPLPEKRMSPVPENVVSRSSSRTGLGIRSIAGRRYTRERSTPVPIVTRVSDDPPMQVRVEKLPGGGGDRDEAATTAESAAIAAAVAQQAKARLSRLGSGASRASVASATPQGVPGAGSARASKEVPQDQGTPASPPVSWAVRASGFQWLEKHALPRASPPADTVSRGSIERGTPRGSDRGVSAGRGRDTPRGSERGIAIGPNMSRSASRSQA